MADAFEAVLPRRGQSRRLIEYGYDLCHLSALLLLLSYRDDDERLSIEVREGMSRAIVGMGKRHVYRLILLLPHLPLSLALDSKKTRFLGRPDGIPCTPSAENLTVPLEIWVPLRTTLCRQLANPWRLAMSPLLGCQGILALELVLVWASFSPIFPLLTA